MGSITALEVTGDRDPAPPGIPDPRDELVRTPSATSLLLREPWLAYDVILFLTCLSAVYTGRPGTAVLVYLILGFLLVLARTRRPREDDTLRSLQYCRAMALRARMGPGREAEASACIESVFRPPSPEPARITATVPQALAPPPTAATWDPLVTWYVAELAAKDKVSAFARPRGVAQALLPTLGVVCFGCEMSRPAWRTVLTAEPFVALSQAFVILLWLGGILLSVRLSETYHAGSPGLRRRLRLGRETLDRLRLERDQEIERAGAMTALPRTLSRAPPLVLVMVTPIILVVSVLVELGLG